VLVDAGPSIHEHAVLAIPAATTSRADMMVAYLLTVEVDFVVERVVGVLHFDVVVAFRFTSVALGRHVVTVGVLFGKCTLQNDAAGGYADSEARSLYNIWEQILSAMA
jgi:hypothetical protein